MRSTRLRSSIALLLAGLIAAVVPLVGPASPAQAVPAICPSEAYDAPLMITGCDDAVAPQTSITAISPVPTAHRYIKQDSVTFSFNFTQPDDDPDPITFECMLYNTAAVPDEDTLTNWTACASPKTYSNLAEFTTSPYTFKVRAVDLADRNIVALDDTPDFDPDPDITDHDLTPAKTTVKVDTVKPNTFITRTPVDDLRPDWPVTLTASPLMTLNSNEGGTYRCKLNTKPYPCKEGNTVLRKLSGGNKIFTAQAVDYAGNVDPTKSLVKFYVPTNIKKVNKNSAWKRVKAPGSGYFGNDYFTASKVGSTLKIKGQRGVREVRLFAPSGPGYGKLEVKVGHGQWYTVNLHSSRSMRQKMYLVRDQYVQQQSGTLQIRVKSLPRGGSVSVDAYVARN